MSTNVNSKARRILNVILPLALLVAGLFPAVGGVSAAVPAQSSLTLLVDPVASPTDQLSQTVTGETTPGAEVEITCEGGRFQGQANGNGHFAIQIDLMPGITNHLAVLATAGQEQVSTTVDRNGAPLIIVQTSTAPPSLPLFVNPVTSPTGSLVQTITGDTLPGAIVAIACEGGRFQGLAGGSGHFAVEVMLVPNVTNHLVVVAGLRQQRTSTAVDRNGNPLVIVQTP